MGCVLATYRTADDLDYKVFMVKDAIMSHKDEYTDMIEDITDSVIYLTLKTMLEMAKWQKSGYAWTEPRQGTAAKGGDAAVAVPTPVTNMQPSTAVNFIVCVEGTWPSRP